MVYELFLQTVRDTLQQRLGQDFLVTLRQIPKNNGVVLDGLCIERYTSMASPTIYLNSYYEEYEEGMVFDTMIEEILQLYQEHAKLPSAEFLQFTRFELAKERIAYKFIHAGSNREQLKDLPHIPFYDLALIFYVFMDSDENGQMTALIHKDHQTVWKISTQDLYRLAKDNTPRLFPPVIKSIEDVLREIAQQNLGEDFKEEYIEAPNLEPEGHIPLYVLTNTASLNGACCMLYDEVLKNFADRQEKDLIILPSSIHEVILIPWEEELFIRELSNMVSDINQNEVPVEDRLSNQIYLYTRAGSQITMISNFSEEI